MAEIPDSWNSAEADLFEDMARHGSPEMADDGMLQLLFDTALFDMELSPASRDAVLDSLYDYVWDEYHFDFDEIFDWEGYREWYNS
jgi:hypothetical protein